MDKLKQTIEVLKDLFDTVVDVQGGEDRVEALSHAIEVLERVGDVEGIKTWLTGGTEWTGMKL